MAEKFGLNEFYNEMKQTGLRFAYEFQISVNEGSTNRIDGLEKLQFFATAASVPGRTLESADVPYQGMTLRVPNNVTFNSPWAVTVRCDLDMVVRKAIEKWQQEYADLKMGGGGDKKIPSYTAHVDLLGHDLKIMSNKTEAKFGNTGKTYVLMGIYPESYDDITLDTSDTGIATFGVNFAYQYWYDKAENNPLGQPGQ